MLSLACWKAWVVDVCEIGSCNTWHCCGAGDGLFPYTPLLTTNCGSYLHLLFSCNFTDTDTHSARAQEEISYKATAAAAAFIFCYLLLAKYINTKISDMFLISLWQHGVPPSFSLSIFSFSLEVIYGILIFAPKMVKRETERVLVIWRALQPRFNRNNTSWENVGKMMLQLMLGRSNAEVYLFMQPFLL